MATCAAWVRHESRGGQFRSVEVAARDALVRVRVRATVRVRVGVRVRWVGLGLRLGSRVEVRVRGYY